MLQILKHSVFKRHGLPNEKQMQMEKQVQKDETKKQEVLREVSPVSPEWSPSLQRLSQCERPKCSSLSLATETTSTLSSR